MRLAVISDVHGNLFALEKAFDFIDRANVDGIIWCGDYITDILLSSEVLEFIRLKNKKYKHWMIKGNREDYIIDYHNSSDKNFSHVDASDSLLYTYNSLSAADIKFISSLPDEIVVDIKDCPKIYVRHKLNNKTNYKYNVFGHVHKQCLFVKDDAKFINPGSIGQCCSGSPGLEFSILELVNGEWSSHFYHISYNLEYVTKFIRNSDLQLCKLHWCDVLINTLESGHNYVDDYLNNVKKLASGFGIDCNNLDNIPVKVWDYVYNNFKFEKSDKKVN